MKMLRRFQHDLRAEMDEAVFVLPVMLLVTFALANFGLLAFASISAGNAANYGARMGSVAQSAPASVAYSAATSMLEDTTVGSYQVSVAGGGTPGSLVRVQVQYSIPNYFGSLAGLFGVTGQSVFTGFARADFRQEGW